MLEEIDDILYQWKQGLFTREVAEQKILDLVADELIKKDTLAAMRAE